MGDLSTNEQLERLAKLMKKGLITQAEFDEEKVRVEPHEEKKVNSIEKILNSIWVKLSRKSIESSYNNKSRQIESQERINNILVGHIEPLQTEYNLEDGEKVYYELYANRMAIVEQTTERTEYKSKKKGVLGRAIVGGVLLGPLGALGGAVTAGSEGKTNIIKKTQRTLQIVDSGNLLLTNRRILFLGNNIISLPYSFVPMVDFPSPTKMVIKYRGMENGEYYSLTSNNAREANLYYKGIVNNLVDKTRNEQE